MRKSVFFHLFYRDGIIDNTLNGRTDRYSIASNSDTTHPPSNTFDNNTVDSSSYNIPQRPRYDSNALLMLPAPLAVNRSTGLGPPISSTQSVRSNDDNYFSDAISASNQRLLPPSPQTPDQYSGESYESGSSSGQRRLSLTSPHNPRYPQQLQPDPSNPFRSQTTSPTSNDDFNPERDSAGGRGGRGIQLTDGGPVQRSEGVRRVSRPTGKRPTSQTPTQNRYSRNSTVFSLPPGAAPPQHNAGN